MKTSTFFYFLLAFFQGKSICVVTKPTSKSTQLKPEEQECVNELSLDKNEIELLNNQYIIPEDNVRFNDFLGCYWQRMGWQDAETGKINYRKLKEQLENVVYEEIDKELSLIRLLVKEILTNVTEKCEDNSFSGNTHGQTIARVQNCIVTTLNRLQESVRRSEL